MNHYDLSPPPTLQDLVDNDLETNLKGLDVDSLIPPIEDDQESFHDLLENLDESLFVTTEGTRDYNLLDDEILVDTGAATTITAPLLETEKTQQIVDVSPNSNLKTRPHPPHQNPQQHPSDGYKKQPYRQIVRDIKDNTELSVSRVKNLETVDIKFPGNNTFVRLAADPESLAFTPTYYTMGDKKICAHSNCEGLAIGFPEEHHGSPLLRFNNSLYPCVIVPAIALPLNATVKLDTHLDDDGLIQIRLQKVNSARYFTKGASATSLSQKRWTVRKKLETPHQQQPITRASATQSQKPQLLQPTLPQRSLKPPRRRTTRSSWKSTSRHSSRTSFQKSSQTTTLPTTSPTQSRNC